MRPAHRERADTGRDRRSLHWEQNGPHGPDFNQRFIGEISADGKTIDGRWERGMGDAGDKWEIDFPINYFRK